MYMDEEPNYSLESLNKPLLLYYYYYVCTKSNLFSPSQFIVLYFPHKIGFWVMRIKQMIIHSNLSTCKMRNQILQICLQGNDRDS